MSRPRTLQDGLIAELRRRIIDAEYPPGSRLPTRAELEAEFAVSRVTMQRAFDTLGHDGFVISEPGSGTLVSDTPPHLHRFGLVLRTGQGGVGGFVDTLKAQAKAFDPAGRRSIVAYIDIDTHSDNENFLQLIHDVRERRLAGLIYVYSSTELHDPAFRENCDIPSVTITNGQAPSWLPAIGFATPLFMERAIRHLASLSRKRVAGISMWTNTMGDFETQLGPMVKKSGMSTHPFWWQAPNLHDLPAISRCVQLMFQGSPSTRPDALIVGDDNLVGPVCDGIVAAGLRVPADVAIVAHACFPHPTPCRLPAVRLGPDVGVLLRLAVEFIDLQAKGKPVPSRTLTPPVFADEVQTAAVRV